MTRELVSQEVSFETFVGFEGMEMMTKADGLKMAEWLKVGTTDFDSAQAEVILERMRQNIDNKDAGWPRAFALIAARIYSSEGHIGSKNDRQELFRQLTDKLGVSADSVYAEGWYDGTPAWIRKEGDEPNWDFNPNNNEYPLKTDLVPLVEEVVTEFLAARATAAEAPAPEPAPVGDGWGEEQKQAAAENYNKLKDPEKKKVDALARAILDGGLEPEMVEAVVNSLPHTRKLMDVSGRKGEVGWIIERQTPGIQGKDQIADALKRVLLLKKLPSDNARGKAIDLNWEFYDGLADALHWRVERLGEEKKIRDEILERAGRLNLRLGEKGQGNIMEIDGAVNQLIEDVEKAQADGLGVALNGVEKEVNPQAEKVSGNIDLIRVWLDNGWRSGKSEFRFLPFDQKTSDKLTAVATMVDLKRLELAQGYSFIKEGNDFKVLKGEDLVTMVTATDGGVVVFDWADGVTPDQGLVAMAVLGQGFNDFIDSNEQFPALFFELAEPELPEAAAAEAAEVEPVSEEAATAPKAAEPPVADENNEESEVPDWLEQMRKDMKTGPAEQLMEKKDDDAFKEI